MAVPVPGDTDVASAQPGAQGPVGRLSGGESVAFLGRKERLQVLPDDLVRRIAEEGLGRGSPADDRVLGVENHRGRPGDVERTTEVGSLRRVPRAHGATPARFITYRIGPDRDRHNRDDGSRQESSGRPTRTTLGGGGRHRARPSRSCGTSGRKPGPMLAVFSDRPGERAPSMRPQQAPECGEPAAEAEAAPATYRGPGSAISEPTFHRRPPWRTTSSG